MNEDMLTVEQAAEQMCMSPRFVRRLVSEHRIAFHRLGRRVRLSPVDIRAYINSARVEPMTEADTWRELRQVR